MSRTLGRQTASHTTLPANSARAVRISVTDLDGAIGFYQDAIGLRLHRRDESEAAMGAGEGRRRR